MTDYTAVKNELSVLSGYTLTELEQYNALIEEACDCVVSQLRDSKYETDSRITHLAAAKCCYRLLLLNQSENLTSFKAGDISYTVSSAAVDSAKELYLQAIRDCAGMLEGGAFAFKAV